MVAGLVTVGLCAGGGRAAHADASDYSPYNFEWQGTSQLFRLAGELGFDMQARPKLDWRKLKKNEILLFLYPRTRIPRKKLVAFLRSGGRVILADDFGSSGPMERNGAGGGGGRSPMHAEMDDEIPF